MIDPLQEPKIGEDYETTMLALVAKVNELIDKVNRIEADLWPPDLGPPVS